MIITALIAATIATQPVQKPGIQCFLAKEVVQKIMIPANLCGGQFVALTNAELESNSDAPFANVMVRMCEDKSGMLTSALLHKDVFNAGFGLFPIDCSLIFRVETKDPV